MKRSCPNTNESKKKAAPQLTEPLLPEASLQDALLQRIRELSFPAYCHLVRLLLYRSGYTSVQIVEPGTGKITLGKSSSINDTQRLLYSGLIAVSHTDLASALTLVRVKQAKGVPVSRRFVDQLRGAMLRLGAEQGLLIATGRFSRYAITSATQTPLPPVRLIDGPMLCSMLRERGLGIRKTAGSKERTIQLIDEPFFQLLEKRAGRQKENQSNGA
ncbi:MAG TPA: restriction endonuclease [Abditibacteriaceae bacterium]|jgi:restriction endonuclease Mrr